MRDSLDLTHFEVGGAPFCYGSDEGLDVRHRGHRRCPRRKTSSRLFVASAKRFCERRIGGDLIPTWHMGLWLGRAYQRIESFQTAWQSILANFTNREVLFTG